MKLVKDTNDNIIAGTEAAYQTDKPKKDFAKQFKKYKDEYCAKHSTKDMVYENGSALALLYKEVTRLNQLLTSNLQKDGTVKKEG